MKNGSVSFTKIIHKFKHQTPLNIQSSRLIHVLKGSTATTKGIVLLFGLFLRQSPFYVSSSERERQLKTISSGKEDISPPMPWHCKEFYKGRQVNACTLPNLITVLLCEAAGSGLKLNSRITEGPESPNMQIIGAIRWQLLCWLIVLRTMSTVCSSQLQCLPSMDLSCFLHSWYE